MVFFYSNFAFDTYSAHSLTFIGFTLLKFQVLFFQYLHWLQFELNIKFLTECEQTFFHLPGQYEKITRKIVEVTSRTKDAQQILDEVTPLFQGDVQLRHMFIRLFPDLSPPPWYDYLISFLFITIESHLTPASPVIFSYLDE